MLRRRAGSPRAARWILERGINDQNYRQRRGRCSATATCSSMTVSKLRRVRLSPATVAGCSSRSCWSACSIACCRPSRPVPLPDCPARRRDRVALARSPHDIARLARRHRAAASRSIEVAPAAARRDARRRRRSIPAVAAAHRSPSRRPPSSRAARAARTSRSSADQRRDLQAIVHQLEEARQPADRRDRRPVRQAGQDRRLHLGLRRPLRSVQRRRRAMHAGIDLAGPVGTPIYATADGVVSEAGCNSGGYGNLVKIDHGRGIETRYGHLSTLLVVGRPARHPRPADRPHGLDRPLDRQPPSLRSPHRRPRGQPDPVHEVDRLSARDAEEWRRRADGRRMSPWAARRRAAALSLLRGAARPISRA